MIRDCTKEDKYTAEKHNSGDRWRHHDTEEVGAQEDGYPGGDIVRMRCINCGTEWKVELPQ